MHAASLFAKYIGRLDWLRIINFLIHSTPRFRRGCQDDMLVHILRMLPNKRYVYTGLFRQGGDNNYSRERTFPREKHVMKLACRDGG